MCLLDSYMSVNIFFGFMVSVDKQNKMAAILPVVVDDWNVPPFYQDPDPVGASRQRYVAIIANQAKEIFRKHFPFRRRCDTYFYTIVLGGNTRIIKDSVNYMDNNGMKDVLDWLLKRTSDNSSQTLLKSCSVIIKRCALFLLLMLFNIVATPVFYVIHTLTYAALNNQEKRISKNIRLPLTYAVFSQKEDMWAYFLSLGVCVMDTDCEGNNVFHYIADISAESSDRAIAIFKMLIQFMDDMDAVKSLVLDKTNTAGLTPLEYVVKYGSPALMTEMLQYPNLLRHTVLAVEEDTLTFNETREPSNEDTNQSDASIDHVDVSRYECGHLVHQSSLLNHLSDRCLMVMSRTDLKIFHRAELIGKWITMKVKQITTGVVSLHVLDIVFTLLLLVSSTKFTSPYMFLINNISKVEHTVFIDEIKYLSHNTSYIFKSEAYPKVLDNVRHYYQSQFINQLDEHMVTSLFEKTSSAHPEFGYFWRLKYERLQYIDSENFPLRLLDAIADTALSMDEYQDAWPQFYIGLHLQDILRSFSQNTNTIPRKKALNWRMVQSEYRNHFHQLKVGDSGFSFYVNETMIWDDFYSFICVEDKHFTLKDLNGSEAFTTPMPLKSDACNYKAHLDYTAGLNRKCSRTLLPTLYAGISSAYATIHDHWWSRAPMAAILSCCLLYLLLDLFERCYFVYLSVVNKCHAWHMITAALGTKVPGSYVRKQLSVLSVSLYFICVSFSLVVDRHNMPDELVMQHTVFIILTALILRFIMHIHAMRLLPGIGHFVITSFMMGSNFLHFSAVFCVVIFIFSMVFHMVIVNKECPVEKLDDFRNPIESLFSTFRLTFGHGELSAFYGHNTAKVTYVMYTVVMGLLLMNLIIGVMSSTAAYVMQEPWRETLWHMEWLEEALSAEYTYTVLGLLCRCCCKCNYISHRKAGYVVERGDDDKYKMYLPIVNLPKLQ